MTESENPNAAYQEGEVRLIDVALVIAENARLLVFGPLLVGLIALAYSYTITPTFTGSTTIMPPQQQQGTMALLSQLGGLASIAGIGGGGGLKNPSDLYVSLVKSRTVADRMIDRFKLMQLYGKARRQDAREILEIHTKVTTSKDGMIVIDVDDKDPKRAAEMANAYIEELTHLTDGLAITEAQQRRVFFEKQLKTVQENLSKAQLALGDVGVSESLIKSSPEAALAAIAQLRAFITAQEIKVATMRGYLTESNPEFKMAQRELDSLNAQLTQAERAQPSGDSSRTDYLNRFRDFKYQETLYQLLARQYETARLDEAREGAGVQIVDVALTPETRSKPRRKLIAIVTSLATGIILLIFVFVRENLRSASRDPESASKLARIVSGMRSLSVRPRRQG